VVELSKKALLSAKGCGAPAEIPPNTWHYKNAAIGIALMAAFMLVGAVVTAGMFARSAQDRDTARGISFAFVTGSACVNYLLFLFVSRRAQKKALRL
jgi:hypothetical protein